MTIGLEHLSCDKRLRELGLLYKSPYLSQNNKVLITHQTEQEQNRTQPGSVSNIFMLEFMQTLSLVLALTNHSEVPCFSSVTSVTRCPN